MHPDILRICSAYDKVDLSQINNLRESITLRYNTMSILEKRIAYTNQWYYAFLSTWKKVQGTCTNPQNIQVCKDQELRVFERNNVSIYSAYAMYMLTLY